MIPVEMKNETTVQVFILEGFSAVQHLGKVLFLVHLLAYLASITGNAVIVTIICIDIRLHTPICVFIYVKPKQSSRLDSNKEAALVNTVFTPLLNPIIYTLRNKQKEMPVETENETSVQEFILEGFPAVQHLGKVLFLLHLLAYLASITGNVVIVTITCLDAHLHTPMYFFLSIFSCFECCFISAVIPKLMIIFLLGIQTISFTACFIQAFVFVFVGATASFLLAVMSLDRYMAICRPLHYSTIMNWKTCLLLVTACIALAFILVTGLMVKISQLSFCGPNVIPHFFCDLGPLIHLSCSNTKSVEMLTFVLALFILITSLIITITAYSHIVVTIIHLPTVKERQKAFSTCSSHLIVLFLMYGSCVFIYVKPKQSSRLDSNREAALVNTVFTPLLNPVIYTLRNKQVHQALKENMCRMRARR
ncbi:PREDICTED: olfactory receptor 49-like [Elephantulus edwardii]|uniref:olfactory receptor 49-like n=1 Tax=Elephantulus edwardii TaxID=28737 RepID=UPI0003F09FB4|nr:PREDICTED: olfactory receptor 49-like [Elephantulus edwardii]